jgi:hypothetical protein
VGAGPASGERQHGAVRYLLTSLALEVQSQSGTASCGACHAEASLNNRQTIGLDTGRRADRIRECGNDRDRTGLANATGRLRAGTRWTSMRGTFRSYISSLRYTLHIMERTHSERTRIPNHAARAPPGSTPVRLTSPVSRALLQVTASMSSCAQAWPLRVCAWGR